MNWYVFLANVVVALHLAYVAFVLICIPLILIGRWRKWSWVRNFWFRVIHFLMILVVVVETGFGWVCPMTTWELDLRTAGGQMKEVVEDNGNAYLEIDKNKEDFTAKIIRRVLFFDAKDVSQSFLNGCYFAVGAMVLLGLIFVPPRWPWSNKPPPITARSSSKET